MSNDSGVAFLKSSFSSVSYRKKIIHHKRDWSVVWLHTKLAGRINRHSIHSHSSYYSLLAVMNRSMMQDRNLLSCWIDYFYLVAYRGPFLNWPRPYSVLKSTRQISRGYISHEGVTCCYFMTSTTDLRSFIFSQTS